MKNYNKIKAVIFITLSITSISTIFSCQSKNEQSNKTIEIDDNTDNRKTSKLIYKKTHRATEIDSTRYSKIITQANSIHRKLPPYNRFEHYNQIDSTQHENFTSILLKHKDESCCTSLYYMTFSPSNDMIDCILLSTNGSDGNWDQTSQIVSNNQDRIMVKKITRQQLLNDVTHLYDSTIKDSMTIEHTIDKSGKIKTTILDSTRVYTTK